MTCCVWTQPRFPGLWLAVRLLPIVNCKLYAVLYAWKLFFLFHDTYKMFRQLNTINIAKFLFLAVLTVELLLPLFLSCKTPFLTLGAHAQRGLQ